MKQYIKGSMKNSVLVLYVDEVGGKLRVYLDKDCTKPAKRSDFKGLLPQQIVISETGEELVDPSYITILSITNRRTQTKLQIFSPIDGESISLIIQDEEDVEDPDDPEENPDD